MPASIIRRMTAGSRLDGPIVATIFVRRAMLPRYRARWALETAGLADAGWAVGLVARESKALATIEEELGEGQALAVAADVSDAAEVESAAARIEEQLGPIDVWVNNAMVSVFAPFCEITPDEFERVTAVTYRGYVNGTRAALASWSPGRRPAAPAASGHCCGPRGERRSRRRSRIGAGTASRSNRCGRPARPSAYRRSSHGPRGAAP
jgi:NAD(P)-dependent dehydrogenase (short-subunit alcohol dehydrogenase family)